MTDQQIQLILIFTSVAGAVATLAMWHSRRGRDQDLQDLRGERNSWRSIANTAVENIEKAVNRLRSAEGKGDFEAVAPVVPEHSSAVTELQQETADVATLRARLVAATAAFGLEPRK